MNYDKFKVGDKVWSEAYGFGEIVQEHNQNRVVMFETASKHTACLAYDGSLFHAPPRPRTFFHAVADTDEAMRAAIARGEGLKRPVPRGRWPIQPGDRVIVILRTESSPIQCSVLHSQYSPGLVIEFNQVKRALLPDGRYISEFKVPQAMRLYDGEEPFSDPCENMWWIMNEAIKFGWHEKYGGEK